MSKEVDLILMKELFNKYRSIYVNERMTEKQNNNVKYWHERSGKTEDILLSQIDNWMIDAKIAPKILTIFDTGETFAKLKTFAVDFEQFLKFIDQLSEDKKLDATDIKQKMLEAKIKS